jgi:hypothetical protein
VILECDLIDKFEPIVICDTTLQSPLKKLLLKHDIPEPIFKAFRNDVHDPSEVKSKMLIVCPNLLRVKALILNEEPSVIAPKTDMEPLFLTSLKTERLEESLPNSLREMEEPS